MIIYSHILKKYKLEEFARYLLIGFLCAFFDLLLLYILVEYFHIWYLASAIISFIIITIVGFFGIKHYTFRDISKNYHNQIMTFSIIACIGLFINTVGMYFFVSIVGLWYLLSNILVKTIVLFWNFLANKYITFNNEY